MSFLQCVPIRFDALVVEEAGEIGPEIVVTFGSAMTIHIENHLRFELLTLIQTSS